MQPVGGFRTVNPFAPPVYQGTPNGAPGGFIDVGFDYVFNIAVAVAAAILSGQAVALDSDADFVWRAVFISNPAVRVRFLDANGYYLSNDYVVGANLQTVVFPELLFPAGGRIGIDFVELAAGAGIPALQLLFRGCKRYRL